MTTATVLKDVLICIIAGVVPVGFEPGTLSWQVATFAIRS